jgi:hypothetical protein
MSRTILDLMDDPALLGRHFQGATWNPWRTVLAAIFGLRVPDPAFLFEVTGRTPPTQQAREAWLIVGRRGGKSRVAALVAVYLACRDYSKVLAAGERGTIMCIASDRRQARTVLRYVKGLVHSLSWLAAKVEREGDEGIDLSNSVTIEVHTASFRAVRGYTVLGVVADETAFWRTDETSAEPDREIFNALRPSMATVPGALLLAIGTPYRRAGEMWRAYESNYGKDGEVLVVRAPTRTMNPSVPQSIIDAALADDEAAASAEWLAEFRRDVENFMPRELVDRAVDAGRGDLPRSLRTRYVAFADPAGGTGADSMTLAIAHREGERVICDAIREARPPFSPDDIVREHCALLAAYGVQSVTGDAYAGDWPAERYRTHGVRYERAKRTASDTYTATLPLFTANRVSLPDDRRLKTQLLGLERRTSRTGRDTVSHGPRGHDDLANSACGSLLAASEGSVSARRSSMSDFYGDDVFI